MASRSWMRRTLLVFVAIGMVCSAVVLSIPRARCALRIAPGFVQLEADPRVFYERGGEEIAARFAAALPAAVTSVEEKLSLPFHSGFRVYVCASHVSFARHIGEPSDTLTRGIAFPRDIWVSPKAFSFYGRDTHEETLAHELTHLHFGQHMGWWNKTRLVPTWFSEGVADWVADTGVERMSRRRALEELLAGRHFVPDDSGQLPLPKKPEEYGVTWPMLHSQSRMFIEYLHDGREERFRGLVVAVLGGRRFDLAFREHYGHALEEEWDAFMKSLG